jgi:hypothetical protein
LRAVLRRIFVPRRQGATRGWRKLHSKKLYNLHSSPKYNNKDDQMKDDEMGGVVSSFNQKTGKGENTNP